MIDVHRLAIPHCCDQRCFWNHGYIDGIHEKIALQIKKESQEARHKARKRFMSI